MDKKTFAAAASAIEPNWARETVTRVWDPGRKLIRSIRRYQRARARDGLIDRIAAKYWVVSHRFWSLVTQCEIELNTQIGGGLVLPHPNGIIIHPGSVIGINCMIFQQVTLAGPVTLGAHCDIGAGAKLMGPLTLGAHVQIGANAVVTTDVPDNEIYVGVPARPLTSLG